MKIHSMEFQGIGPFPSKHEIDFDLLGDSALVLIEGPTGVGKSTILDAITFAFFGAVEQGGGKQRIRSHHSKDQDDSYVRVRFSTQAGVFEVSRFAERYEPKSRGVAGMKKIAGSCTLSSEVTPGLLEVIEIQASQVGTRITELLGMTRDQFEQIVLLPQGEFETFLMSSTKDRKPLLEKIFNTHLFSRLKEKIHQMAQKSAELNGKHDELVLQSASALFPALEIDKGSIDEIKSDLKTPHTEDSAIEKIKLAAGDLQASVKMRKAGHSEVANRIKVLEVTVSKRREESNAKSLVNDSESKLAEATRAKAATLTTMPADAGEWFQANGITITKGASALKPAYGKLVSEIAIVEKLLDSEKGITHLEQERAVVSDALLRTQERLKAIGPRLKTELPELIRTSDAAIKGIKTTADSITLIESKLQGVTEQLKACEEVIQLAKELESTESEVVVAADALAKSKDSLAELEERRFSQYAFELSQALSEGDSCQVCGSKEHPDKPEQPEKLLAAGELDKAKKSLLSLEKNYTEKSKEHTALAVKNETARAKVKRPIEELELEKTTLAEGISSAQEQLVLKEKLQSDLEKLMEEKESLSEEKQLLAPEEARLIEVVKTADAEISRLNKDFAKSAEGFESIAGKLDFLLEVKGVVELLSDREIEINTFRADLKTATEALKKFPKSDDFGDIASAEALVQQLRPELDESKDLLAVVLSRLIKSEQLFDELTESLKTRAKVLADSTTVIELDRVLVLGKNPAKQTIDTFVLQNMFSEVVHAANSHFTRLLEGRYELKLRGEDANTGNSQAGLDLEILDLKTQRTRVPKSLSGGEVFCASLSLALGLSDVVLSSNGGIRLETFFIDEGFGSLDSERLNQVMEMLNMIRNTGRTVGVISHVEEMKQAILDRIEVTPQGNAGASTLTVSWAT
jgi:exonuclease SbcC